MVQSQALISHRFHVREVKYQDTSKYRSRTIIISPHKVFYMSFNKNGHLFLAFVHAGYLSFNFSSSFDLVYKYMEFNISCLKNKSMKMLMMVSWLLLTLQRDCHREKCLDAGVGRGWRGPTRTDYLLNTDQKIPRWVTKITFQGKVETVVELG